MWTTLIGLALAADPELPPCAQGDPRIAQVGSPLYGAYAVIGPEKTVLVDTWGHGKERRILRGLEAAGVEPSDVSLIVVTHAHGDHAGAAGALAARLGVPVAAGLPDVEALQSGVQPSLSPTGPAGRFFKPFAPHSFDPVKVNFPVSSQLDLHPYGVRAEVRLVGGHTPGSVIVVTDDKRAVVGDLVRSRLPGPKDVPWFHLFHHDMAVAHAALRVLVGEGVSCFYVGHGGPLTGPAVQDWLQTAPNAPK